MARPEFPRIFRCPLPASCTKPPVSCCPPLESPDSLRNRLFRYFQRVRTPEQRAWPEMEMRLYEFKLLSCSLPVRSSRGKRPMHAPGNECGANASLKGGAALSHSAFAAPPALPEVANESSTGHTAHRQTGATICSNRDPWLKAENQLDWRRAFDLACRTFQVQASCH